MLSLRIGCNVEIHQSLITSIVISNFKLYHWHSLFLRHCTMKMTIHQPQVLSSISIIWLNRFAFRLASENCGLIQKRSLCVLKKCISALLWKSRESCSSTAEKDVTKNQHIAECWQYWPLTQDGFSYLASRLLIRFMKMSEGKIIPLKNRMDDARVFLWVESIVYNFCHVFAGKSKSSFPRTWLSRWAEYAHLRYE